MESIDFNWYIHHFPMDVSVYGPELATTLSEALEPENKMEKYDGTVMDIRNHTISDGRQFHQYIYIMKNKMAYTMGI